MPKSRIAVVEDERIVAKHIENVLNEFGYACVGIAASADEAVRLATDHTPDLFLMDIRLKGKIDGIAVSRRLRDYYDIPVVFLTAFADDHTLSQAKLAEPFGFIIKPFGKRELYSAIEIALYRHMMESKLRRSERNLQDTLRSLDDAVISTDNWGYITFMNAHAETLTGWIQSEAVGRDISQIFRIRNGLSYEDVLMLVNGNPRRQAIDPLLRDRIARMVQNLMRPAILIARDGEEKIIDNKSAAVIRDDEGNITGAVIAFRECNEDGSDIEDDEEMN